LHALRGGGRGLPVTIGFGSDVVVDVVETTGNGGGVSLATDVGGVGGGGGNS